jgi:hypothetical protein
MNALRKDILIGGFVISVLVIGLTMLLFRTDRTEYRPRATETSTGIDHYSDSVSDRIEFAKGLEDLLLNKADGEGHGERTCKRFAV